jgi:hypothetical protein
MATSHPHLFQQFITDESEICQLVTNHFLPDCVVPQWHPACEGTPNTKEIVVFSSFFQRRFVLPACVFLRRLLDHYKIELVHLNPNSILQISIFGHLCEAFLGILPNFPLFKNYFFLKYQPSATNQKVIGGVGLQTCPRASFLDLPWKHHFRDGIEHSSIVKTMNLASPPFIGRLQELQGTWSEEPTPLKFLQVAALTNKINTLKECGLIGVCVATH